MAIDPISGASLADPGIVPPSATGVSQFIDQITGSLQNIVQTWATPTPPSGPTYAPMSLGGTLPLLLLAGGGYYLLTRTSGRTHARNPTRRYKVKRLASPRAFDRRSFRTVRLPGGRLLTVGCPRGHWGPHTQRCRVGTRGQRIMTPKHHSNPGRRDYSGLLLIGGLLMFPLLMGGSLGSIFPQRPVTLAARVPHPYVISAGHPIFN